MTTIQPGARPYFSVADDVNEDRAQSTVPDLSTVGDMRAALTEVEQWADGLASVVTVVDPDGAACFQKGAQDCLHAWVSHTRHLLRKLSDESVAVEVPHAAVSAMHEVASFAVQVANTHNADPAIAPHTTNYTEGDPLTL